MLRAACSRASTRSRRRPPAASGTPARAKNCRGELSPCLCREFATPEARRIPNPPSSYQRRLYYDSVAGSEEALRFLLDQVGADRVVLGSDWPFVPWHPSPVAWVQGLASLTPEEKERILWRNLEQLLGL